MCIPYVGYCRLHVRLGLHGYGEVSLVPICCFLINYGNCRNCVHNRLGHLTMNFQTPGNELLLLIYFGPTRMRHTMKVFSIDGHSNKLSQWTFTMELTIQTREITQRLGWKTVLSNAVGTWPKMESSVSIYRQTFSWKICISSGITTY
jgi:hypothetical protein